MLTAVLDGRLLLTGFTVLSMTASVQAQEVDGILSPLGLAFPLVVSPACPGEGCAYGTWMTCDSVAAYESAGDERPIRWLEPGLYFEVVLGSVRIATPGVVS